MTVGLAHYLAVAAILFTIGVFGIFVNRKNIIVILMSLELILLAVNINLVAFSAYLHDITGQIFAMFVLTVAAAEAAVGLAILVTFFRNRGDIAVDKGMPRVILGVGKVFQVARIGQGVEVDDFVIRVGLDDIMDKIAADKPGAPSNQ